MTSLQYLLYALGCARFKRYRRWVGGRWAALSDEPTLHASKYPRWRWKLDPGARFTDHTHAIEQWPITLPEAYVRRLK